MGDTAFPSITEHARPSVIIPRTVVTSWNMASTAPEEDGLLPTDVVYYQHYIHSPIT